MDQQNPEENAARLFGMSQDPRYKQGNTARSWVDFVGPLLTIITVGATVLIGWGKTNERLKSFEERITATDAKVAEMDKSGTVASQRKTDLDHQILTSHELRIQKTEDAISSIAVMKEQIARMGEDVRAIKAKP